MILLRLLYVSTALHDLKAADIQEIVTFAKRENAKNGISGALGYNGVNFAQVLEAKKPRSKS